MGSETDMGSLGAGTALEPETAALLQKLSHGAGDLLDPRDIAALRIKMEAFLRAYGPRPLPVEAAESRRIDAGDRQISLRIYWPPEPDPSTQPAGAVRGKPIVLYFHGGGFTHFSAASHDPVARYLCNRAQCIVVNVDYRLAPEHKFPAPIDDAYDVLCWVHGHADELGGDSRRIVVVGESAGGTICAALCLMAKSKGGPGIAAQIPMCASFTLHDIDRYPSWARLAGGEYLLTPRNIEDIRSLYLKQPQEQLDPLASPLLAPDLRDMPPALVIAAEFDPLVDEATHYADRLRQAQVPVTYRIFEGTIHSFMIMCGAISLGYSALDLVADRIALV